MNRKTLVLVSLTSVTLACSSVPKRDARTAALPADRGRDAHERLHGVLWVQTSAEFDSLSRAVYRDATSALDRALAEKTWTAALEQVGDFCPVVPQCGSGEPEGMLVPDLGRDTLIQGPIGGLK